MDRYIKYWKILISFPFLGNSNNSSSKYWLMDFYVPILHGEEIKAQRIN